MKDQRGDYLVGLKRVGGGQAEERQIANHDAAHQLAKHGRLPESFKQFTAQFGDDQDYCHSDQHRGIQPVPVTFRDPALRCGRD